jgi:hypothetical protein
MTSWNSKQGFPKKMNNNINYREQIILESISHLEYQKNLINKYIPETIKTENKIIIMNDKEYDVKNYNNIHLLNENSVKEYENTLNKYIKSFKSFK